MTHIPTGFKTKAASRSQYENRKSARAVLESRVAEHFSTIKNNEFNSLRLRQVGSGMRGDKIRTYREKDDVATDHRNEKKVKLSFLYFAEN